MMKKIENARSGIMKRVCGIPKRSHHKQLLQALNISSVNNMLIRSVTSLYTRIFNVNSTLRDLCVYDLTAFMASIKTIPSTITHRLTQLGLSPVDIVLLLNMTPCHSMCRDGVIDSLNQLIYIVTILLSHGLTSI